MVTLMRSVIVLTLLLIHAKTRQVRIIVGCSLHLLLEVLDMVIGIIIPLDGHSSQQPRIQGGTSTPVPLSKSRKRKSVHEEKDENDKHHGNENPKRRRNCKYHPDKDQCSPCTLWSQSGSDNKLKPFHPKEDSRHAGTAALALSQYAAFENIHFNIRPSDFVCTLDTACRWKLVCNVAKSADDLCDAFSIETGAISFFD